MNSTVITELGYINECFRCHFIISPIVVFNHLKISKSQCWVDKYQSSSNFPLSH